MSSRRCTGGRPVRWRVSEPSDHLAPLLRLSPTRAVLAVAWPMVALGWLKSFYFLANSFWVSRLGTEELAALGGSAFAWWATSILCDLGATGTHALIAREEGAGKRGGVGVIATQGLWLAALVGGVLAIFASPLAATYTEAVGFGLGSAEATHASRWLEASLLSSFALGAHAVVGAVFRGLGWTRLALVITTVTLVVNAALDPLLIWGWGPVPSLGIAGTAWATAVSNLLGAWIGLVVLARRGRAVRLSKPVPAQLVEITRVGLPIVASGLAFCFVYVLMGRIVNTFGPHNIAALGLGHRVESLAYMVCVGFQVAASTLVGQWLGAGQPDRARECAAAAARINGWVVAGLGALLAIFATPLFRVFGEAPVPEASAYLRWQALVFVFMAWECVYEGAFVGARRTVPPLVVGFLFTAARVPLALWWSGWPDLGIDGVWIAIAVSTLVKGVLIRSWWARTRIS